MCTIPPPLAASSKLGVLLNEPNMNEPNIRAPRAGHFLQLPSGYLLQGHTAGQAGLLDLLKYLLNSEQDICQEKGILWNSESTLFSCAENYLVKRTKQRKDRSQTIQRGSPGHTHFYVCDLCLGLHLYETWCSKGHQCPLPLFLWPMASCCHYVSPSA